MAPSQNLLVARIRGAPARLSVIQQSEYGINLIISAAVYFREYSTHTIARDTLQNIGHGLSAFAQSLRPHLGDSIFKLHQSETSVVSRK